MNGGIFLMSANETTENKDLTGLDQAEDRKSAEMDIVTALLSAAEYKMNDDEITEVEIKRRGNPLFSVRVHPISEEETQLARKKATTKMPNPNGKKFPPIDKEFNNGAFKSWLIYLATVPEDQEKIWGQKAIMNKFGLKLPMESIDVLLKIGEKNKLADTILDISGVDDDDEEEIDMEDYSKN